MSAPQEGAAPTVGPDGPVYPGTCRHKFDHERNFPELHPRPAGRTLRLDMARAVAAEGLFQHRIDTSEGGWHSYAGFDETGTGPDGQTGRIEFTPDEMILGVGDVVLARRDMGTSYHLSVVVDDAAQGITEVTRGQDLFEATKIHVVLQALLGLPTPSYHHHGLIRDEAGKRLAKRDDARALAKFRAEGATPADIRSMVGLPAP